MQNLVRLYKSVQATQHCGYSTEVLRKAFTAYDKFILTTSQTLLRKMKLIMKINIIDIQDAVNSPSKFLGKYGQVLEPLEFERLEFDLDA